MTKGSFGQRALSTATRRCITILRGSSPRIADLIGPAYDDEKRPSDLSARGARIDRGGLALAEVGIPPKPLHTIHSQNQADPINAGRSGFGCTEDPSAPPNRRATT